METDRKILLTDREYPRRLLEIPQAPKQLYVRGKLPEEGVPSVAVTEPEIVLIMDRR